MGTFLKSLYLWLEKVEEKPAKRRAQSHHHYIISQKVTFNSPIPLLFKVGEGGFFPPQEGFAIPNPAGGITM
jgi:hypothetical protein